MRVTDEMAGAALAEWRERSSKLGYANLEVMRAALEAALSHAAGQEVDGWALVSNATGRAIKVAGYENDLRPIDGYSVRPFYLAPAVARSEGE